MVKLDIINEFPFYKIGDRVFFIDDNNFDFSLLNIHFSNIISILDKGFKFVPCFHFNIYSIFINLLKNFEDNLSSFNFKLFLKKELLKTDKIVNIDSRVDLCKDLNCFYKCKHNKNKIDLEKIPFQKETLDFKFNFFEQTSTILIQTKHNMSSSEFNSICVKSIIVSFTFLYEKLLIYQSSFK